MSYLALFYRLVVRPLGREPLRTSLTVLAVALGVAVVVAIELAGAAATGSFRSSLEALSGDTDLELSAIGGLEDGLAATLATLPYPLRIAPRITGYGLNEATGETVPVVGWDLVAHAAEYTELFEKRGFTETWKSARPVWAGSGLGVREGDRLRLTVNARTAEYTVAGVLDGDNFSSMVNEKLVVMDISTAQEAFSRFGRLDRIDVGLPPGADLAVWTSRLERHLPEGVRISPQGARQEGNRRMLTAFRWNLRVLSYISVVVGAFLIYNTIAVSVVRRRAEIGVLRALGAGRRAVLAAFLAEAAVFGLAGGVVGVLLGRLLAEGAVGLIGKTVESLYISSAPDPIALTPLVAAFGIAAGIVVSVLAALAPAREAALVPPVEAMARGRHEYQARLAVGRDLALGVALAILAAWASQAGPVRGMPLYGYASAILFIGAAAFAMPAIIRAASVFTQAAVPRWAGVEALLGSRSLAASLWRTSVLAGALTTAVAMMTSVGIMVGSFRETVIAWMDDRLRADLYLRPAGDPAPGEYPTMDAAIAGRLERLPGVAAVDRFRAYPIFFNGLPSVIGGTDSSLAGRHMRTRFLPGSADREEIFRRLPTGNYAIVSEPFANKHGVAPGQMLKLPFGGRQVDFEVLGVYYDYSNERGFVLIDRAVMLRYLPDPDPSNLAVYLGPGADSVEVRAAIERELSGAGVLVFPNALLRREAVRIFDRTFAITYALQAVAVLVAVVGIAGALLALVIDRRRELGVLRFLGASAGQIRKLILFEAGWLGLLANLTGLGLGVVLSLVLIYVINKQSFGWTIQFHWPVAMLAGSLALVFAATIAAALWPARVAIRLNPIEVVHEE